MEWKISVHYIRNKRNRLLIMITTEQKNNIKSYIIIALLICAMLLFNRSCNKSQEVDGIKTANESAMDSMHKKINEQWQEITTTKLIVADYKTIKNKLFSSDSTIKKLQAIIDKHTISATILNNQTNDKGTTATTIIKWETIDSLVYPVYETTWNEQWSKGKITASNDSIHREVTLFNEFAIKQSYEKQKGLKGFLKPRVAQIEITNKNPMTITTAVKSFSVEPDKNHRGRVLITGIVIGFGSYYLLSRAVN